MLLRCLGVYNNFRLVSKPEPEAITTQRQKVYSILERMSDLLPGYNPEE